MPHAFEVEGQGLEKDLEPIKVGATSTLRLNLPPGSYELYCPIESGAHEKMGMVAHIEVLGSVDLGRLVTAMKQGGYVIVLRHGATNPNQADTDPLHRDNIGAQRLLSAQGREIAVRVGDAFRTLGIPLGKVYSSEFNRATETAKLVSGKNVKTTSDLTEGGLVVTPTENARRAKALKAMASTMPDPGSNTLIVTHKRIFSTHSAKTGSTARRAKLPCSSPTVRIISFWSPAYSRPIGSRPSARTDY